MSTSTMNKNENILNALALSFFRRSSNISVLFENIKQLNWEDQKTLLDLTVEHPRLLKYPPERNYTKYFLKNLLKVLTLHTEVHDDIYKWLCKFMEDNTEDCHGFCYQHYIVNENLNQLITIKETNRLIIHGTTGLRTWEAGLVLADWSISNKHLFVNKNVLELGCGAGFSGIVISKFCAPSSMYFTDYNDDVLKIVYENIDINFPEAQNGRIENCAHIELKVTGDTVLGIMKLDWKSCEDISDIPIPNVVIGADIVYDPSILLSLCNMFTRLFLMNSSMKIYIAGVVRNECTFNTFLNLLEAKCFDVKLLEHSYPQHIHWDLNTDKYLIEISKINIAQT